MLTIIGLTLALLDFSGLSRFLEHGLSVIRAKLSQEYRELGFWVFVVYRPLKGFLTAANEEGKWTWDFRYVRTLLLIYYLAAVSAILYAYVRHLVFPEMPWKGDAGHLLQIAFVYPLIVWSVGIVFICGGTVCVYMLMFPLYWMFYLLALPPSRTTGSLGLLVAIFDFWI